MQARSSVLLATLTFGLAGACSPPAASPAPAPKSVEIPPLQPTTDGEVARAEQTPSPPSPSEAPVAGEMATTAPTCTPADWSSKPLKPLLRPGTKPNPAFTDRRTPARSGRTIGTILGQQILATRLVMDPCTDYPNWRAPSSPLRPNAVMAYEINFTVLDVKPAGKSGRNWPGGKCSFGVDPATGGGRRVVVDDIAPFNGIGQVVRSGSAVYVSANFNGYAREFPQGGNNVVALDTCEGLVKWKSPNLTSSGPMMLLGDYLVTGYGFTAESHFVYVLDAHTGAVVQKLPVPKTPEEFAIEHGVLVATLYEGKATFELLGP